MTSLRSRWEQAFVATSLVLGEPEDAIERSLGHSLGLPSDRDARARAVATMFAAVVRELDAAERGPWGT